MDDGQTWRLFDVSYNSVANIIDMFPEIFDNLAIKEPQILTAEQEAAQEQASAQQQATAQQQAATPAAGGKKPAARKK